ncbi:MAG TPA: UbiD family decarboxylase, partial [Chloroflexota bacterium]|nr:UbiD family decarboxylase [Chloroflexota bacterium]
MAFRDLREFLKLLDERGELRHVTAEVDPELEITEITDRVVKAGGPALLFENVKGSRFPLATNIFGSEERMSLALGVKEWGELERRLEELLDLAMGPPPKGILGKLGALGDIIKVGRIGPKEVSSAACQEVVETANPSLADLPIMKCWPDDGGKYITLPLVFTHDPATGRRNVGMYRLQVFDDRTLGMHWQL